MINSDMTSSAGHSRLESWPPTRGTVGLFVRVSNTTAKTVALAAVRFIDTAKTLPNPEDITLFGPYHAAHELPGN